MPSPGGKPPGCRGASRAMFSKGTSCLGTKCWGDELSGTSWRSATKKYQFIYFAKWSENMSLWFFGNFRPRGRFPAVPERTPDVRCDKLSTDFEETAPREKVVGRSPIMMSVLDQAGEIFFACCRRMYSDTLDCAGSSFRTASNRAESFLVGVWSAMFWMRSRKTSVDQYWSKACGVIFEKSR